MAGQFTGGSCGHLGVVICQAPPVQRAVGRQAGRGSLPYSQARVSWLHELPAPGKESGQGPWSELSLAVFKSLPGWLSRFESPSLAAPLSLLPPPTGDRSVLQPETPAHSMVVKLKIRALVDALHVMSFLLPDLEHRDIADNHKPEL